jgi:hypothetical protein
MLLANILDNQNYHHQPKLHVLHRHPLVQGVLYPAILKRGLFHGGILLFNFYFGHYFLAFSSSFPRTRYLVCGLKDQKPLDREFSVK